MPDFEMPPQTLEEKAAAWDAISEAWVLYARMGPTEFDWDYASRPFMAELTDTPVSWWYGSIADRLRPAAVDA